VSLFARTRASPLLFICLQLLDCVDCPDTNLLSSSYTNKSHQMRGFFAFFVKKYILFTLALFNIYIYSVRGLADWSIALQILIHDLGGPGRSLCCPLVGCHLLLVVTWSSSEMSVLLQSPLPENEADHVPRCLHRTFIWSELDNCFQSLKRKKLINKISIFNIKQQKWFYPFPSHTQTMSHVWWFYKRPREGKIWNETTQMKATE